MRKKILSFLLALLIIPFAGIFSACGNTDGGTGGSPSGSGGSSGGGSSGGSGGGSGSGANGGNGGSQVETVLYDLKVSVCKPEDDVNYQNTLGCKVVWLPDGKTMVIDPRFSDDRNFRSFYYDFTNGLKRNPITNKLIIDYLVVTQEDNIGDPKELLGEYSHYEVKNYYRPDIEINLDNWKILYDDSQKTAIGGVATEDVFSISPEHLEGRSRVFYEEYGYKEGGDDNRSLLYEYNEDYILSLALAQKNGVNIEKITNDTKITNTITKDGNDYTYTIDFWSPEPIVNQVYGTLTDIYGGARGDKVLGQEYIQDQRYYDQIAEYNTILSINYGEFDLLYIDKPTENVFNSFFEHHDKTKKYDVILGDYRCDVDMSISTSNFNKPWARTLSEYYGEGEIAMSYLYDINKIDTNYIISSLSSGGHRDWYGMSATSGTWMKYYFYGLNSLYPPVMKKENVINPVYGEFDDMKIPVITVQKNGVHNVVKVTELNMLGRSLMPTIDGEPIS